MATYVMERIYDYQEDLVNFYKKRSDMERKLLLLVVVLILLSFILILFLILSKSSESNLCTTVECVEAANHILEYIDPSTDPCHNFYQFACGSFLSNAYEYDKQSAIEIMKERTKHQINAVIMEDPLEATTHSLKLQRQFYQSCINESAIEDDENETFLTLLDSLGGWPVIKGRFWEENTFDWTIMMIKCKKLGTAFERFVEVGVELNENITDGKQIRITYPSDVEYIGQEMLDAYTEVMRDIAVILHAPSVGSLVELRNTVLFQNNLSQIISKAENLSQPFKEVTIHELEEKFPKISWLQFLNNLLDEENQLKLSDKVLFNAEQYLKDLEYLLLRISRRTQGNYIVWKIIEKNIPFLTKEIRDRYRKFQRQYHSKKAPLNENRKEVCLQYSKDLFKDVAEIEFIKKHTDSEIKSEILNIVDRVKEKLIGKLLNTKKLSIDLDLKAIEDVKNTIIDVGGSDDIYDEEKTEKFLGFSQLAFKDNNLINMITSIGVCTINNYFSGHRESLKLNEFSLIAETYTSVNAFYVSQANRLILPVTLLQDIMYNKKRPNYMNYGSLVSSIGHEFTHSLNKLGNTTYVKKNRFFYIYNDVFFNAFGNSSKCFQEEYESFVESHADTKVSDAIINSNDTLEENIADFVGTDLAYELYEDYVNQHGEEMKLPGVKYTPKQIFWIMTGTFMCEKDIPRRDRMFHAGSLYRINYRLRNLPEFARDYNCPVDSFMNPSKKCEIF